MKKQPALMITCEHASHAVPAFVLRALNNNNIPDEVLQSHRGYDIGAYNLFSILVKRLNPDFYCSSRFSRLIVDMNRSSTNKSLFSEFTTNLPSSAKTRLLNIWQKYRDKIEKFITNIIPENERSVQKKAPLKIIHLGIHSFTPIFNGVERNADVGILYDPSRTAEVKLAETIIKNIHERAPWLRIRKNYPYLGKSDGLTTSLRKKFGSAYAGLEIEISQGLLEKGSF